MNIGAYIKDMLLNTAVSQMLYNRVNGLNLYTENLVTMLNGLLREKINDYRMTHDKFSLADTKAVYDPVPDRMIPASRHYNDLVNVEFTSGYDVTTMDWGAIWRDQPGNTDKEKAISFWTNLIMDHIKAKSESEIKEALSNLSLNLLDYIYVDAEGIAQELIGQVIEKVIVDNVDPHPETYGQYALGRSFADALGWDTLPRRTLSFNANGGSGTMASRVVVALDGLKAFTKIDSHGFTPATGFYFTGWNTSADGSGTSYADGQLVGLSEDVTLYAQWSNLYTVSYKHKNHTGGLYGDDETGHMECYALYINGELKPKLGRFDEGRIERYRVPYGSTIKVWVDDYMPNDLFYNSANCDVYVNGVSVSRGHPAEYTFTLTGNVDVEFRWKIAGSLATFNAQSWEDCYITIQ